MSVAPELQRERDHLARARAELARMREQTLSLEAHGGDRVSSEFLASTLHRRAQSLVDDPTSTLFFGRIDRQGDADGSAGAVAAGGGTAAAVMERYYVGRRHVADAHGDPVVIDWRAEMSTAFYRASRATPMGVVLRRRFGIDRGALTAYEDEHLTDPVEVTGASDILATEIERPRVGPMRDIVATIQPEQDVIVRADVATTICVQGAPGTGKTAVGLHRAAWLLYALRDRLARAGVLVIGPNRAFLDYIGAVLPALGEVEVSHATIEDLLGDGPPSAASTSVDDRCAQGRRADGRGAAPGGVVARPRGRPRPWSCRAGRTSGASRRTRCRRSWTSSARAASGTAPRRQMLPHRLAHAVLVRMEQAGDSPDDRVQDAVARSAVVRRYAGTVWPAVDPPRRAVRAARRPRRARPGRRRTARRGRAAPAAVDVTRPGPVAAPGGRPPTRCCIDEIRDHLERTPSLGHVVLDEAQDLSPMQLRAVGRRCSTGSATVLGDIAQGTTPWATDSWDVLAAPPRQARRARRGAGPRVPRAGDGDRVRRPAAAVDRARARRPGVGA